MNLFEEEKSNKKVVNFEFTLCYDELRFKLTILSAELADP